MMKRCITGKGYHMETSPMSVVERLSARERAVLKIMLTNIPDHIVVMTACDVSIIRSAVRVMCEGLGETITVASLKRALDNPKFVVGPNEQS